MQFLIAFLRLLLRLARRHQVAVAAMTKCRQNAIPTLDVFRAVMGLRPIALDVCNQAGRRLVWLAVVVPSYWSAAAVKESKCRLEKVPRFQQYRSQSVCPFSEIRDYAQGNHFKIDSGDDNVINVNLSAELSPPASVLCPWRFFRRRHSDRRRSPPYIPYPPADRRWSAPSRHSRR